MWDLCCVTQEPLVVTCGSFSCSKQDLQLWHGASLVATYRIFQFWYAGSFNCGIGIFVVICRILVAPCRIYQLWYVGSFSHSMRHLSVWKCKILLVATCMIFIAAYKILLKHMRSLPAVCGIFVAAPRIFLMVAGKIFIVACGIFIVVVYGIFVAAWGIFSCGIWDLLVLVYGIFVVAHGIFVVACGIFQLRYWDICCSMWDLSCGM